jgi:signal transduction histidine kinase
MISSEKVAAGGLQAEAELAGAKDPGEQMIYELMSMVHHELRTPLTAIQGALGLLAGGMAGELPEKARSLVDIAARNSERLVRLINGLLEVIESEWRAGETSDAGLPEEAGEVVVEE